MTKQKIQTKLYLIRHGETEWNKNKLLMGQKDIPLNALGLKQAEVLANYLNNFKFDAIYSSDLSRARATAEAFADKLNQNIIFDKNLRECSAGILEGLTLSEIINKRKEDFEKYKHDPLHYLPPEGETRAQFIDRVSGYIVNNIIEKHHGETVAVVCHGGVIRALLGYVIHADAKTDHPYFTNLFAVDNCSISAISYFSDGLWQINYFNDTHFLAGLTTSNSLE